MHSKSEIRWETFCRDSRRGHLPTDSR